MSQVGVFLCIILLLIAGQVAYNYVSYMADTYPSEMVKKNLVVWGAYTTPPMSACGLPRVF